jgi:hypothetical protein
MPLFHDETTITPFKRREPMRRGGQNAIIYTADNYHELLAATTFHQWDDEDVDTTKTVRVSLSIAFQIKLGMEGRPTAIIPAHEKLTGRFSLIAGNLGFNAANEICIITNKSSDYLPNANALQYLLIVMLYENKFTFADNLVIRLHSKDQSTQRIEITKIQITRELLIADLQQLDFYRNYYAKKAAFTTTNSELVASAALTAAKGTYAIIDNGSHNSELMKRKAKTSPVKENIPEKEEQDKPEQLPMSAKRVKVDSHEFFNPLNHSLALARVATEAPSSTLNISSATSFLSSTRRTNQGSSPPSFFSGSGMTRRLLYSPIRPLGSEPLNSRPPLLSSTLHASTSGISPNRIPLVTDLMTSIPKPYFGPK